MPTEVISWLLLIGLLAVVALQIVLLVRAAGRSDLANDRARLEQTLGTQIANIAGLQSGQLDRLMKTNEVKLVEMRATLEAKLKELQIGNEAKLEQMRLTVDEKLHKTLETRLGESFKLVSERLEAVHKGLGDMQTLAADVGNLQKVLTNVKARGTWGEVQLENLLEPGAIPHVDEDRVLRAERKFCVVLALHVKPIHAASNKTETVVEAMIRRRQPR